MQTSITLSAPVFVGLLMAIWGGGFQFIFLSWKFTLSFWEAKGFDSHSDWDFRIGPHFLIRASLIGVFRFGEELRCISV